MEEGWTEDTLDLDHEGRVCVCVRMSVSVIVKVCKRVSE